MQNNTWFTIQLTEFQVVIDLTREIFLPILLSQFPYQQHSPQYIHRTSRKKPLKFQSIVFLNSPIVTFLKTGKICYSDIRVKIDIAMILSSQAQIVSSKIARATHQLCSWRKLLKNCCYGRFSVVLIEITNTLVKVHIYLSVYLCIYLFIYLSTYLYLDMICILFYLSIYVCMSISISIYTCIYICIYNLSHYLSL